MMLLFSQLPRSCVPALPHTHTHLWCKAFFPFQLPQCTLNWYLRSETPLKSECFFLDHDVQGTGVSKHFRRGTDEVVPPPRTLPKLEIDIGQACPLGWLNAGRCSSA
eukprot:s1248_g2.t1